MFSAKVTEPSDGSGGYHFKDYLPATKDNKYTGNFLEVKGVEADKSGRLYIAVYRPRGVKPISRTAAKTVLNALQIRVAK